MNWIRQHLHYSGAVLTAIVAATVTVAVSFGLHLTQHNIDSILTLAGLLLGGLTVGGGVKTAGLIRAGAIPNGFSFTPAFLVSVIGAGLALALSFGLHVSQDNIDAIMKLVGLLAGGIVVGGSIKSQAMLRAGNNTLQTKGRPQQAAVSSGAVPIPNVASAG